MKRVLDCCDRHHDDDHVYHDGPRDRRHGFHFQYPDRFAADLRAFLRR